MSIGCRRCRSSVFDAVTFEESATADAQPRADKSARAGKRVAWRGAESAQARGRAMICRAIAVFRFYTGFADARLLRHVTRDVINYCRYGDSAYGIR